MSNTPSPNSDATGLIPRDAALRNLHDILKGKSTTDALFSPQNKLNDADFSLYKALIQTTLRHYGESQAIMAQFMPQPFAAKTLENIILSLGISQLLWLDGVAPHAAIFTTVELAKKHKMTHLSGVFNAVLRKVQKNSADILANLAPETAIPAIWAEQWRHQYGISAEQWLPFAARQAAVVVRVRDTAAQATYQAQFTPVDGLPQAFVLPPAQVITDLPEWTTGGAIIQDMAAQLPVALLAAALGEEKDKSLKVLDMCAAPGGKTVQLADALPAASLTALELSRARLPRLEETLSRCHLSKKVKILQADGTKTGLPAASVDAILLDAPCTANGTSRRHPEVLWARLPSAADGLSNTQQALLTEALRLLKPGGVVVYATCSLLQEEGETQIARLKRFGKVPFTQLSIADFYTPPAWATVAADGCSLRTFPHVPAGVGADGFYMTALQKQ